MWQTIGQEAALTSLERALASGRPAHAYLFSGPEGVGKTTAALDFAAALNCTGTTPPCGECRPCRDTYAAGHTDVELVAPGGLCDESEHRDHADSRDLRICQIRRLQRVLSLAPYSGARRVAILEAADSLHMEAANAFLKTLEEPPDGTVIILLAEREERLPETVRSRCQRIAFRPVAKDAVETALRDRGASPEQAELLALTAGARIGWAIRVLADPDLLTERGSMLDAAVRVAHGNLTERFAWARAGESRAPETRERCIRELGLWEGWWRDVLAAGAGASAGLVNRDRERTLLEEGKLYAVAAVIAFLRSLAATREHLRANIDPQLALENLILDLPAPSGRRSSPVAKGEGPGRAPPRWPTP